MARLNNKHKNFIVKQLAMFEQPSKVRDRVKEEFNIAVGRQQVAYYNPENQQGGRELARKWRHLFNETRDTFIAESGSIPISHKNYRLRQLQKNYRKLADRGEIMEACKVLEQAAKETSGVYEGNSALITANENGTVNFLQQVNKKIEKKNQKAANTNSVDGG